MTTTPAPEVRAAPEKWFSFFGLIVLRRTDLLAAAAFILSLSTILYQTWNFMKGASPAIYPPDTLYVFFDRYPNGVTATRFAGQLSFTNGGEVGHNAIIRDVSANITVGSRKIEQYWLSFATVARRDTELDVQIKEAAHPFVINGGGAVSHMVTFSPRVKDCTTQIRGTADCQQGVDFVSDTEFLNILSQQKAFEVTFSGSIFDSRRKLDTKCMVSITEDLIQTMAKNNWYAARCIAPA